MKDLDHAETALADTTLAVTGGSEILMTKTILSFFSSSDFSALRASGIPRCLQCRMRATAISDSANSLVSALLAGSLTVAMSSGPSVNVRSAASLKGKHWCDVSQKKDRASMSSQLEK